MNKPRIALAGMSALVTSVTLACKDIPLLPKWDADWNVPLPSQPIGFPFAGVVPPGTSGSVSSTPQQQSLDGSIGSILDQNLSNAALVVVLSKTLPVSSADTIFVAPDSVTLTNSLALNRIVVPVGFTATDASVTDTVAVTAAGIQMLQSVAQAKGSLWVQLRGRVSYAGPGNLTVTAADSIHVRLSLLATIAISR